MTMPVHKRGDRWHYAFCIRRVRYRGALPEARTKVQAQKAETKIRQEVYDGRYGRPTGETSFEKFVENVYKPWARENKRSFENNEKYKLPMIYESKSLKDKTFAQISPLLIEKYKKERRESELENGRTRKPSTINRELQILSRIFSLAIRYGVTDRNPCAEVSLLPENNKRVRYLLDDEEQKLLSVLTGPRGHLLPLVILAIGSGMRLGRGERIRTSDLTVPNRALYQAEPRPDLPTIEAAKQFVENVLGKKIVQVADIFPGRKGEPAAEGK
jgi:integrase